MNKVRMLILMATVGMIMATISPALAEKSGGGKTSAKESIAKSKDPVCGMEIDPAKAKDSSVYKGKTYRFCSGYCKGEFDKNPAKYIK